MRKLLCIEAVFALERRGLVVLPALGWGSGRSLTDEAAELRRPDGRVIRFQLDVCPEHRNRTPEAIKAGVPALDRVCMLKGIAPPDVTIGSEIWCTDAVARDALGDPAA